LSAAAMRGKAFERLRSVAAQFRNSGLAALAVEVKAGGHFDKVIAMIDDMMALLRKEEQDDIAHRDRCENAENGNKNELEDLASAIEASGNKLKRLGNTKDEVVKEIGEVKKHIKATEGDLDELTKMRNSESDDFIKALKEDTDAVALIKQAIGALSKFYTNNKISMAALQKSSKGPVSGREYAKDIDKAPETSWEGADYGGRQSESTGILAIMEMLAEDLEKEIADGRADDAAAQEKYLKQRGALEETLAAQNKMKVGLEEEEADLEAKMDDTTKFQDGKKADQKEENNLKGAIGTDCSWVATHFEARRTARKSEMDGLTDAKEFLSGAQPL